MDAGKHPINDAPAGEALDLDDANACRVHRTREKCEDDQRRRSPVLRSYKHSWMGNLSISVAQYIPALDRTDLC